MSKRARRQYWCACTLIKLFNSWEEHAAEVKRLYREAEQGKIQIVTSTASVTEVNGGAKAPEKVRDEIRRLFRSKLLEVVEVDIEVAERARELLLAHDLRSIDAIHLATAIIRKCDVMLTTDGKLLKCDGAEGISITQPRWSGQLDFFNPNMPQTIPVQMKQDPTGTQNPLND